MSSNDSNTMALAVTPQQQHSHPPVLHHRVASTISRVSTATRFSLRCSALVIEAFFETAKYSTSASLSIGRNILISALSSARNINLLKNSRSVQEHVNESPYETILDRYTNLGIYFVHHSFTLAELFSLTTFHLTSSTIKFSLKAAEETVRVIDGLFGSTETSRALSAIVEIVKRELYEEHEGFLHNHTSKLSLLGGVTKAITAFACLQKRTRRRQHQRLQLEPIAEYTVSYDQVRSGDPMNDVDDDLFMMNENEQDEYGREFVEEVEGMLNKYKDAMNDSAAALHLEELKILGKDTEIRNLQNSYPSEETVTIDSVEELPLEEAESSSSASCPFPTPPAEEKPTVLKSLPPTPAPSKSSPLERFKKSHTLHRKLRHHDFKHFSHSPHHHRHQHSSHKPSVSQPKHIYPRQPLSANLARYVKFATGAYGKRFMRIFGIGRHVPSVIGDIHHANHHSFAGHTDIPVHCILLSSFQPPSPSSFLFESYLASSGISGQSNGGPTNFFNSSIHKITTKAPKISPLVHYLAVDHKSKAIVLTLRGTLGLSDVLTDLTCDYADIEVFVPKVDEDGKVVGKRRRIFQCHEGMLKQAQMMANEIGRYVKRALEEYDEYGLLLCGHSLGGAVASLLALLWSDRFNDPEDSVSDSFVDLASENELIDEDVFLDAQLHRISASSGLPKGRPLHCYAFGSPSVISHELSQLSSTLVTTVIHGMDLVPSLSLGLVKDLKLIAKTLTDERNKGVAEKVITKVLGLDGHEQSSNPSTAETEIDPEYYWNNSASMDSLEEDWFWSLIQTLRAECTSEKLYPAGSIYWVRDNNFTKRTYITTSSNSSPISPPLSPTSSAIVPVSSNQKPQKSSFLPSFPTLPSMPFLASSLSPSRASTSTAIIQPSPPNTVIQEKVYMHVSLDLVTDVASLTGELKFSRTMFTDHAPRFYEDALKGVEVGVAGGGVV